MGSPPVVTAPDPSVRGGSGIVRRGERPRKMPRPGSGPTRTSRSSRSGPPYDGPVPAQPRPAATVVLLRPGDDGMEVLLTRRPAAMAFAADVFVFPGGRVDPGDADPRLAGRLDLDGAGAVDALGGGLDGEAALAFHVAAIREVFEEVGVLLGSGAGGGSGATRERLAAARAALLAGSPGMADVAGELDLRLAADRLAPVGHWTTPTVMPRRFDTRFFAAELPPGATIDPAPGEIVDHRWLTPRAALDAMNAGDLAMWLPTSATLQHLEGLGSLDEIRSALRHGPVTPPRLVEPAEPGAGAGAGAPGERRIGVGGAGAVPGRPGEVRLVGRREIVVIDPGDPSEAALGAIRTTAETDGGRIVAIALTSAHPDRAAGAEALALELEAPVVVGPGGGRDLPYEVVELAAGAVVPFGDATEPLVLSGGGPGPGSG